MNRLRLERIQTIVLRVLVDGRTHLLGLSALVAYCVHQAIVLKANWGEWDFLAISGFALLLVGVRVAPGMEARFHSTLDRLLRRGVLQAAPAQLVVFRQCLARLKQVAHIIAAATMIVVTIAFLLAWAGSFDVLKGAVMALEVVVSYIAGFYLGRMALNGRLMRALREAGIRVVVHPGHPDGAAGLAILGDVFFRQAALAGIPAIYLAFWVTLFPVLSGSIAVRYSHWAPAYFFLLPFAIAFEVAAALIPLYSIHREMIAQKIERKGDADRIARRIAEMREAMLGSEDPDRVKALSEQVKIAVEQFEALEKMPTWPARRKIRQRFALNNLALILLPVLGQIVGEGTWGKLVEAFQKLFGGSGGS